MRKHYLDNIRWMTIVLVVIFHIYFYYNNIDIAPMFTGVAKYNGGVTFAGLFQYVVYPWFMLLLFIVSGVSARMALKKRTNREFMRSRVDKLLAPSTLGVLAFGWVGGFIIYTHNASATIPKGTPAFVGVIITFCTGIGALWFCHVLLVAVLVLILIRCFVKDDDKACAWFAGKMKSPVGMIVGIVVMFLILWGGSHILNMPMITSYRNGIYIPAFLMGYYIFSNDEVIENLKKAVLPLLVLSVAAGIFYIWNCYGMEYGSIRVLSRPDTNAYAFLMVLLVMGATARFLDRTNSLFTYMKNACFGIYVFHIPVLLVVNYFIEKLALPMTITYLIELVTAFFGALLIYEVFRRIPILRYWTLGIRKKKNS